MFDVSRELGSSVALYSRKVLIQTKATDVLPKWLRFIRGMGLTPWGRSGSLPDCVQGADWLEGAHISRVWGQGKQPQLRAGCAHGASQEADHLQILILVDLGKRDR